MVASGVVVSHMVPAAEPVAVIVMLAPVLIRGFTSNSNGLSGSCSTVQFGSSLAAFANSNATSALV